jgi:fatty acid amide hydrolase 2
VSRPLTERSAVELAAAIRHRSVSSVEVVEAHIGRLRQVAPAVNGLVGERFAAARDEAALADEMVAGARPGAVLPSLLGVPFTVKESIALAGMPQSAGLMARREIRAERSAPPVARLAEAGAIPLGVTNTSELTLWIESVNRVYGRTSNPYDRRRTAGGSSGGEGAIVGAGGSPFGIASDIGGSIRKPALFCGVFGHKPSAGLVPATGSYPPGAADNARMLGIGPIARRAEDLMPVLRVIAGPDGEDQAAQPLELGDPGSVVIAGLRVVMPARTSFVRMNGELVEAWERAAEALRALGARVERVGLPSWRTAWLPFLAAVQAGAGRTVTEILVEAGADAPTWRSLLARSGPHTTALRLTVLPELLPRQLGTRPNRRLLERAATIGAEVRATIGGGVMLYPAHPTPAPRHGRTVGRPWVLTGAAVFNLAGVPATEVPLGLSEHGLPLGVQVAAGHGGDHVTIAVAQALERAFGGWRPPSGH